MKENSKWDNLSMSEKSFIIGEAVKNNITSLQSIRDFYNSYESGGDLRAPKKKNYVEIDDTDSRDTLNRFSVTKSLEDTVYKPLSQFNFNRYNIQIPFINEDTHKEDKTQYHIPKGNPTRTFITNVNQVNSKISKAQINEELNNMSEDDVLNLQKKLADYGWYDKDLSSFNSKDIKKLQTTLVKNNYLEDKKEIDGILGKKSITALQEMLVDKGFLPENTKNGKSNIDGILGEKTQNAYNNYLRSTNIDGILGSETRKGAIQMLDSENKGFNTYVSAEGMVDQCARFVTKKFDTVTGESGRNGVYGNAWNMLTNIERAGGESLFNIYNSPSFKNAKSSKDIKDGVKNYFKNNSIDYSVLKAGDVVGIHMPSSSHYDDVLATGSTYNTHIGIVVDVENGVPIIEHNILGKVRREKVNNLTGSLFGKPVVTAASRPKYEGTVHRELKFNPNIKSSLKVKGVQFNEQMQQYANSLAQTKQVYKDIFPDVDLDFIEKAAIGIVKRETNFMRRKQSDLKSSPSEGLDWVMSNARSLMHTFKGTHEESISQDLTKMKFSSLPSAMRKAIGLYSPEQLSQDPIVTGRAVMTLLSKNYDYFKRLAANNPDLGLTKEDIENATIQSYNEGLRNLSTLGFNRDGSSNQKELAEFRNNSKKGAKIKNINHTNYKYLGDVGKYLYDNFEDPHLSYTASARSIIDLLSYNE